MRHLLMLQASKIIIIIVIPPPRSDIPAPNGGANRRGRSRGRARGNLRSASPGVRSNASNDNKGKGKGKFDSRKMGCMYFNQGKGSCTVVHFPTILVSQCMFLKEKVKESVRDLVLLVLPLPLGGVGETPLEDATPPDAVRRLEEIVESDLLTLQNAKLNLAVISQEEPVPSGIGVLSSIMVDKQESRTR